MQENKTIIEKDKKRQFPINVLSKKGLACIALTGVLATTPLVFAGCSSDENNLNVGTRWETGTNCDSFTDARKGDFFIDTDDYILYKKTADGWEVVFRDYGKPAESAGEIQLQVGSENIQWKYSTSSTWNNLISIASLKGANGNNGYTPYIENGYWYINSRNTGVKATATDAREIDIRVTDTAIQWQRVGDSTWTDLVQVSALKGLDGANGTNGVDGENGTKWYSGTSNPSSSNTANDGDFYLNTENFNLFKMTNGTWVSVGNMKAKDGANWYNGAKVPDSSLGTDGDYYLNTSSFVLYQKANGTWGKLGSIKAQNGTDGADGTDGTTWATGEATLDILNNLTDSTYKAGDFYLNTQNYDIYQLSADGWTRIGNIKAQDGKDGKDGADGVTWYSGTLNPNSSEFTISGKVNDFYLDTSNYDLYQKTANGWLYKGNITGAGVELRKGATHIQWKSTTSEQWTNLIAIADLKGADGVHAPYVGNDGMWYIDGESTNVKAAGTDGKQIKLQSADGYIQWQYEGDTTWNYLIATSTLKGADGATWFDGEGIPNDTTTGKDGDFYLDTKSYDIYKKSSGTWSKICNIKGADGKDGTTWHISSGEPKVQDSDVVGDFYVDQDTFTIYVRGTNSWTSQGSIKGKDGENGTNVCVGYDGYIWQGSTRTEFKAVIDETGNEDVWEDTLGTYKYMRGNFTGKYLDLSTNTVALMQYYTAVEDNTSSGITGSYWTIYGGTTVKEISVVSENGGTLRIGKAEVSDVVSARRFGASTTLEVTAPQTFTLGGKDGIPGKNGVYTITFDTPLVLADNETIVLGGANSTAKIYMVQGIPVDDEVGNFSLIDSGKNLNIISKDSNNYADTLAIKVKAYKEVAVFPEMTTDIPESNISSIPAVLTTGSPYTYLNLDIGGKTITKIGVTVKQLNNTSGNAPTITVYKYKSSVKYAYDTNYVDKYTLTFPTDTVVNTWAYGTPDKEIVLAEDEALAFGAPGSTDTLVWGWYRDKASTTYDYGFKNNAQNNNCSNYSLLFDIYVQENKAEAIESLKATETEAVKKNN